MPIKPEREYRKIDIGNLETRDDEMIVEGYATTFNEPYLLFRENKYAVYEQVDPSAFERTDMTDVIFQYDHQGRVFARNKNGTLEISTDEHGLKIRANLGGTEEGRKLYEEIKGGYTDKMSFGFTVRGDKRETTENKETGETRIDRIITDVGKLYDVSAVSIPANDATEISARSVSEGAIADAVKEINAEEERQRKLKLLKLMLGV